MAIIIIYFSNLKTNEILIFRVKRSIVFINKIIIMLYENEKC